MFFAITGTTELTHKELREIAHNYGHHIVDFVNERTNYLIANYTSTTRKYKNAKQYGVTIITEQEFKEIVKEREI